MDASGACSSGDFHVHQDNRLSSGGARSIAVHRIRAAHRPFCRSSQRSARRRTSHSSKQSAGSASVLGWQGAISAFLDYLLGHELPACLRGLLPHGRGAGGQLDLHLTDLPGTVLCSAACAESPALSKESRDGPSPVRLMHRSMQPVCSFMPPLFDRLPSRTRRQDDGALHCARYRLRRDL